jgi:hypothetical protein
MGGWRDDDGNGNGGEMVYGCNVMGLCVQSGPHVMAS